MDDTVKKKLQELFTVYSKNLPEKIHQLEVQWQQQLAKFDLVEFQNFHRNAHSLCGSAGTYGYTEIGHVARKLEIQLRAVLATEKLTPENKIEIDRLLDQLKSTLIFEAPKKFSLQVERAFTAPSSKNVLLLTNDKALINALKHDMQHAGYIIYTFHNPTKFLDSVVKQDSAALLIDTDFLTPENIDHIVQVQKQQPVPIPLFCTVPNSELLPRLAAVRVECDAFFQKPIDPVHVVQELNHKINLMSDNPYRVLVVDDSQLLAEYYTLILNQTGINASYLTNPLNLFNELETFQPNLLLMDIYMPECTGLELAAVLRHESNYTKMPIIFLTTETDKNKKLSAINLGGDDFLTKPVSPRDLISAVRSRSKRASILNYYMKTDSLTGLLNHASILDQLTIEVSKAKESHSPVSFVMVDIDNFKNINDQYGHPFGDQVLKALSTLFLVRLRRHDWVGRYGGEEFAIILPGTQLKDSTKIMQNFLQAFSQTPFEINKKHIHITFSAGIAAFDGLNNGHNLIMQADQALYQAKHNGRNQVVAAPSAC